MCDRVKTFCSHTTLSDQANRPVSNSNYAWVVEVFCIPAYCSHVSCADLFCKDKITPNNVFFLPVQLDKAAEQEKLLEESAKALAEQEKRQEVLQREIEEQEVRKKS